MSDFSSWQDRKNEKCQQNCQQSERRFHNPEPLHQVLWHHSFSETFGACDLLNVEKDMQLKYRLYRRCNGIFYWQENGSKNQGTLRTRDKRAAEKILHAMNESHRQPTLNLSIARACLAAHDPKMAKRTWQSVMDEMATHGIQTTQQRCARGFRSKAYNPIRNKPLVQTTGEDLLGIIHANGNCVAHYIRRLHNLAVDLGWLAWPILPKRAWPKIQSQRKRAMTPAQHLTFEFSRRRRRSAATEG